MHFRYLTDADPQIADIVSEELERQRDSIELIASENFVSPAVMEAVGTPLTNKYAEGYPSHRFYGGCWAVDKVEQIAQDRAQQLFGAAYVNVQPHSGSQANYAALASLMKPGETLLGMNLSAGGHLTHGAPANFSGKLYHVESYGVDEQSGRIDYDAVEAMAKKYQPQVIIAGASAYPRIIDFERFAEIAHKVGAYLLVDMAHIAGLVAAGRHPSPIPYADIVTTTTHKTLRGTRGGLVMTNSEELYKKINSAVFPGCQGGPLMHVIAGKAVALQEALQPSFATYIDQVIANCKAIGEGMSSGGLKLVSGGSDNHLQLVDLTPFNDVSGKQAEKALEAVGITANKNTIPNEKRSPFQTSGLRIGTPAITTRGFNADECRRTGELIAEVVAHIGDESVSARVRAEVSDLLKLHPLYPEID